MVLKTNMEEGEEGFRYAWHIMQNRKTIFKIPYQIRPYAAWQIPQHGRYFIKAFVKNAREEKVQETISFTADRHTSPKLETHEENPLMEPPVIEHISGPFYKMYLRQKFPESAQYAWYVYRSDEKEPVSRQMYSHSPEYIHTFREAGKYYVKVFLMLNGMKNSVKSDPFPVQI